MARCDWCKIPEEDRGDSCTPHRESSAEGFPRWFAVLPAATEISTPSTWLRPTNLVNRVFGLATDKKALMMPGESAHHKGLGVLFLTLQAKTHAG